MRIAAVGDLHCSSRSQGQLRPLFRAMADSADVMLLCGDLTNYGLPEEAAVLCEELETVRTPKIAVLGNHDFESGQSAAVREALTKVGVSVLDGSSCVIDGVGFAGVKGFCGGFVGHSLEAWGEPMIKHFVKEAANEEIKLDAALARLEDLPRVAVLHYSPIRGTVEGEPIEIFPFLGSMRLEEALLRHKVEVAFHGHAHHGSPQGQTRHGTPVYNVAMALLQRVYPGQPPFRTFDVSQQKSQVETSPFR